MNQKKLKDNTNAEQIYKGSIDCLIKVIYRIKLMN